MIQPRKRDGVRRVYLAGPPYADEYPRRAVALLREIGWEPIDPMRRDYRGRTEGSEAKIVEGDLAEIDSCDAVLAAFTSPDEGTARYVTTSSRPCERYPPDPLLAVAGVDERRHEFPCREESGREKVRLSAGNQRVEARRRAGAPTRSKSVSG